jgi:hypothetical protein
MPLQFRPPPPTPTCNRGIGLLAIQPGEVVLCRKLGALVGLMTHWVPPRTIACLGERQCRHHEEVATWKGFMPVEAHNRNWRGLAQGRFLCVCVVSEEIGAYVDAAPIGTILAVSRPSRKRNGWMEAVIEKEAGSTPCPPTFDVLPYVVRAMRIPQSAVARLKIAR